MWLKQENYPVSNQKWIIPSVFLVISLVSFVLLRGGTQHDLKASLVDANQVSINHLPLRYRLDEPPASGLAPKHVYEFGIDAPITSTLAIGRISFDVALAGLEFDENISANTFQIYRKKNNGDIDIFNNIAETVIISSTATAARIHFDFTSEIINQGDYKEYAIYVTGINNNSNGIADDDAIAFAWLGDSADHESSDIEELSNRGAAMILGELSGGGSIVWHSGAGVVIPNRFINEDAGGTNDFTPPNFFELCGNSIVNTLELCDDGAQNGQGGSCNMSCGGIYSVSECGNGLVEGSEVCDDGVANGNPNKCDTFCTANTVAVCGNAVIETGEACDDGPLNGTPNYCNNQCADYVAPVCGNGVKEAGETCDDGNVADGDECDSTCRWTGNPCDPVSDVGAICPADGIDFCAQYSDHSSCVSENPIGIVNIGAPDQGAVISDNTIISFGIDPSINTDGYTGVVSVRQGDVIEYYQVEVDGTVMVYPRSSYQVGVPVEVTLRLAKGAERIEQTIMTFTPAVSSGSATQISEPVKLSKESGGGFEIPIDMQLISVSSGGTDVGLTFDSGTILSPRRALVDGMLDPPLMLSYSAKSGQSIQEAIKLNHNRTLQIEHSFQFGPVPQFVSFSKPVKVEIPVDGLSGTNYAVYHGSSEDAPWEKITFCTINFGVCTFYTSFSGLFLLGGEEVTDEFTESGGQIIRYPIYTSGIIPRIVTKNKPVHTEASTSGKAGNRFSGMARGANKTSSTYGGTSVETFDAAYEASLAEARTLSTPIRTQYFYEEIDGEKIYRGMLKGRGGDTGLLTSAEEILDFYVEKREDYEENKYVNAPKYHNQKYISILKKRKMRKKGRR